VRNWKKELKCWSVDGCCDVGVKEKKRKSCWLHVEMGGMNLKLGDRRVYVVVLVVRPRESKRVQGFLCLTLQEVGNGNGVICSPILCLSSKDVGPTWSFLTPLLGNLRV
jgi:hypothetical protein